MELAFAGLHQLCAPLLDRLERLPAPQREALEIAFGLSAGAAPDRFLVGLGGARACCREAAEERPLLCVVDDAQWLDQASAQALAFVARRLLAEPVGIVFAAREPGEALAALPELVVRRACATATRGRCWLGGAGASWTSGSATGSSPRRGAIRWRCWSCREGLTATQLAGGFGLLGAQALPGRIEESFVRRLEALSDDDAASVAGRGGGAGRRSAAAVARGRAARDRGARPRMPRRRTGCWRSASG